MVDFLLDPNLAYIFLIGGFTLALMAILTPGTGLLEISAVFAFVLAGWGVYRLAINYWALIILLLSVIPFIWAVRKSGQVVYLGVSILALVVGSAFFFRGDAWWKPAVNPVLALVVSVLVGGFFWIVARKSIEAGAASPAHDLGPLIGAVGEAKTQVHQEGTVQVRGELWSAVSDQPIQEGAAIRVIGRQGFMLEVEEVEQSS
jgi:membrane-bound serine protease (ClpP class)